MSLFREMTIMCPSCSAEIMVNANNSVNVDRAPELREEILDGVFQRMRCNECNEEFRLDPDITYLDVGRGQWIAVHPFSYLGQWESLEQHAQEAFDKSYGATAPKAAQQLGANLTPRMVFGWAALTEKIVAFEHDLDDLALELTKIAILQSGQAAPFAAHTELRLAEVKSDEDELVMMWLIAETGETVETLGVPKSLYDELATKPSGWDDLSSEFTGKLFIDMQRLILASV